MENNKNNPLLEVGDVLDEEEIEEVLSKFNESQDDEEKGEGEEGEEESLKEEKVEDNPSVQDVLVQVSVRIPRVLRTRAKILAARHQITLSTMIIRGLEMVLDQLKMTPKGKK